MEKEVKTLKEEKATLESYLAKVKVEADELQTKLQEAQDDLTTVKRNFATSEVKVMNLEKAMNEAEEKHQTTLTIKVASREEFKTSK